MKFSIVSILILIIFFFIQVNGEASDSIMTINHKMTLQSRAAKDLVWASPDILENGTLFYIALSISTLLWCTGKGLIMTIDQQERKANYLSTK